MQRMQFDPGELPSSADKPPWVGAECGVENSADLDDCSACGHFRFEVLSRTAGKLHRDERLDKMASTLRAGVWVFGAFVVLVLVYSGWQVRQAWTFTEVSGRVAEVRWAHHVVSPDGEVRTVEGTGSPSALPSGPEGATYRLDYTVVLALDLENESTTVDYRPLRGLDEEAFERIFADLFRQSMAPWRSGRSVTVTVNGRGEVYDASLD